MKVMQLEGRMLDYWVAVAEGWQWAKNAVKRSGDGWNPGVKPRWPVGAHWLVTPDRAKGLNDEKKNWDGWLAADLGANGYEVAEHWDFYVPRYSTNWADGGPIIDRELGGFTCMKGTPGIPDSMAYTAIMGLDENRYQLCGPTHLVAAMRAFVASRFGTEVSDKEMPQVEVALAGGEA